MTYRQFVCSLYDNCINIQKNHKDFSNSQELFTLLVKPMYRVDLLLWYLRYFVNIYETHQNFANNYNVITVNGKKVNFAYSVKEGDIISYNPVKFLEDINSLKIVKKKIMKNRTILPFIEYDKYTNTILIVKGIESLDLNDLTFVFDEMIQPYLF